MKPKQKTTAEIMREAFIRLGGRSIIVDGRPVEPAKMRRPKTTNPGGNGAKK